MTPLDHNYVRQNFEKSVDFDIIVYERVSVLER